MARVKRGTKRIGRPPSPTSDRGWRTRKEAALTQLRELQLERERGKWLPAEATARAWEDLARRVRAALLAVPSRFRARCPHLTAHDVQALDEELRAALTALADGAA